MDDADHRADGYRALGQNIAVFSEMVAVMRDLMSSHLWRPGEPTIIGRLVFAQTSAGTITHTFFAMCWALTDHSGPGVEGTVNKLSEEVQQVVRRRNDFAHGDWQIATLTWDFDTRSATAEPSFAVRIDATRKKKPLQKIQPDLDKDSDNIERLKGLLDNYGRVCFGAHSSGAVKISDVIRTKNRVVILGPKAAAIQPSR